MLPRKGSGGEQRIPLVPEGQPQPSYHDHLFTYLHLHRPHGEKITTQCFLAVKLFDLIVLVGQIIPELSVSRISNGIDGSMTVALIADSLRVHPPKQAHELYQASAMGHKYHGSPTATARAAWDLV